MPHSIVYDNTKIAVARILGDGERQRTRVFAELQSHYLFQDRFGRPAKGNDKGKVEGLVGFARRNFMVPVPAFESFEALNAHLDDCCRKRMSDRLRGHTETIAERLERDLAALRKPLPPPYDACEKVGTRVSSLSLVRYRRNDYSVPTSYGHHEVMVRGYVHEVVIACGTEIIARALPHRECYQEILPSPGQRWRIGSLASMAGNISMGARREVVSAAVERYHRRGRVGRVEFSTS